MNGIELQQWAGSRALLRAADALERHPDIDPIQFLRDTANALYPEGHDLT